MIEKLFCANKSFDEQAMAAVYEQLSTATMAEDSLGRLQEIAVRLAGHQGVNQPNINKPWVSVFASDHGAHAEDVSDLPQAMTAQWVDAFCKGNSITNGLVNYSQASLELIDVGVAADLPACEALSDQKIANGTANFAKQAAMSTEQLVSAMEIGMTAAERAKQAGTDVFIGGTIAVANNLSAMAMIAVLSGKQPLELVGMGRKRVMSSDRATAEVIENAIALHKQQLTSPLRILQHLGGFETAALCGAYIRCAQLGITIVVDGLMASVAAWIADMVSRNDQLVDCESVDVMMDLGRFSVPETMFCICGTCPRLLEWCFFAHQSADLVHSLVLEILAVEPMLKFEIGFGQGVGAVLAIPLMQQACVTVHGFQTSKG